MSVVGIDLGTTNSCVAARDATGEVVVIANSDGARTTPSMVAFTDAGEELVGTAARRQQAVNPARTIHSVKRLMGRALEETSDLTFAYETTAGSRDRAAVAVNGKVLSPEEVSSKVLVSLRETAEAYLGKAVTEAVITVPAYFNDAQRQATKDAGRIAGLDVKRIINEPTAAALAYGLDKDLGRGATVAVYDFGGGTFDISILRLTNDVFEVLATAGDPFLGGDDVNRLIADIIMGDLERAPQTVQRAYEEAERVKHELSATASTDCIIPFLAVVNGKPIHFQRQFTRSELEEMVDPLIERSLEPCRRALTDAGLKTDDIDEVLLVGGQTRMPRIQQVVKDFFGKEPNRKINPDEVVAIGAAVQADNLVNGGGKVLLDVTPLTIGVETAGGVMTPIVPRNTTVPTKKSMVFSTAQDNQPIADIHVSQGERPLVEDNKTLGRFQLVGIPPAPRGVPQIQVAFDIDCNGILKATAKDLGTGKSIQVNLTPGNGLTPEEVERIISEAEQYKTDDAVRKAVADMRNQCDALVYSTRLALEEYGHLIDTEDLEEVEADIKTTDILLAQPNPNLDDLKHAFDALTSSAACIADAMYREAEAEAS